MNDWMMTLIGADRPGIVAHVTRALADAGASLGEASMLRLGNAFTIMMRVRTPRGSEGLRNALQETTSGYGLRLHIDPAPDGPACQPLPNVQVRVEGADRTGIVADVTGALLDHGFNILELESVVAGETDDPVYIMHIEGYCEQPPELLQQAIDGLGIHARISAIETLIG